MSDGSRGFELGVRGSGEAVMDGVLVGLRGVCLGVGGVIYEPAGVMGVSLGVVEVWVRS